MTSLQTLQQSRGFGSAFRFPESAGGQPAANQAAPAGQAAFGQENDDDLYD